MTKHSQLQMSYDRVAAEYTTRIADELAGKPLDRALLRCFAEQVGTLGPICDAGCGPGHVGAFLADLGAVVVGLDVSSQMLAHARRRSPAIPFFQGDLRSFGVADASFGGIVAFYSIIHLAAQEFVPTFREWWRVLRPGGRVLIGFHVGATVVHLDEWWQEAVDLDFRFVQPEAVSAALEQAQFTIEAVVRRAPDPAVEHSSERAYMSARKDQ